MFCVRSVDTQWKDAMSFPKMRQFKDLDAYLSIYGNNVFFDGIKVECSHKNPKNEQIHRSNHKYKYKAGVVRNCAKQLMRRFVVNGGHWGPNLEYSLGRLCRQLKDPKDHSKPNLVLRNYLIPIGRPKIPKVEITSLQGKQHRPTAIHQLHSHGDLAELMLYVNAGTSWTDQSIYWSDIDCTGSNWTVQKVKTFRFHCRKSSFAMSLEHDNKCIMKTNNNHIFQFKNAYTLKYLNQEPILIAYGCFWPLHASHRPNDWVNDQFSSLPAIKHCERESGWFFMTNLIEPVFLIHRCVSYGDVRHQCPEPYKNKPISGFYKRFTGNLHNLMLSKEDCQSAAQRKKIQLPCGPIFKCKKHNRSRCRRCVRNRVGFDRNEWNEVWKCNIHHSQWFYVLDFANGLAMTLMKSVHTTNSHEYGLL